MTPAASTPASIEGPSVWRDRKRYLWPLGLLIPLSPFISWFLVDNLRLGLFWATGAWLLVIVIPIIDMLAGEDGESPPDDAIPRLQKDRYYPLVHLRVPPLAIRRSGLRLLVLDQRSDGNRGEDRDVVHGGRRRRRRYQRGPRARPQEREDRTVARESGACAISLRALLRGTQFRPPCACSYSAGPGQLTVR